MDSNLDILRYILVKTVDDDEHSTIKLVNDENLDEIAESEMDETKDIAVVKQEESEADLSEAPETEKAPETIEVVEKVKKEEKSKKEIDQIDEVIDQLTDIK